MVIIVDSLDEYIIIPCVSNNLLFANIPHYMLFPYFNKAFKKRIKQLRKEFDKHKKSDSKMYMLEIVDGEPLWINMQDGTVTFKTIANYSGELYDSYIVGSMLVLIHNGFYWYCRINDETIETKTILFKDIL